MIKLYRDIEFTTIFYLAWVGRWDQPITQEKMQHLPEFGGVIGITKSNEIRLSPDINIRYKREIYQEINKINAEKGVVLPNLTMPKSSGELQDPLPLYLPIDSPRFEQYFEAFLFEEGYIVFMKKHDTTVPQSRKKIRFTTPLTPERKAALKEQFYKGEPIVLDWIESDW